MSTTEPRCPYTQIQDSQLKWPHMFLQWICIRLVEIYLTLNYQVRYRGHENKPKGFHSYVVASNHVSSLDPPLVSLALDYQPIAFLAKVELFEKFWMRTYNWGMSSIAVNRDKMDLSTVKSALKVLKTGQWALGVFPEGSRSKSGEVQKSKKGVAYFAHTAKVPVLPIGIAQFEKNGKKRIEVHIGEMIPCEGDMETMGAKVEAAIQALVEKARTEP